MLADLARDKETTLANTIRDAVTLEKWATDRIKEGSAVILRQADGSDIEVLLG